MRPITSDDWIGDATRSALGFKDADTTTEWLGSYAPYTCKHCGKTSDTLTPYCAYCGRRAVNSAR